MAVFTYKENKTRNMKVKGVLNSKTMEIETEEGVKNLVTLLSEFDGIDGFELSATVKTTEDLDEPSEVDDEEDE